MQTPFQSRRAETCHKPASIVMSNGAGDEIGWLAPEGHLCGFQGRARFDTIAAAAQAAADAEKRHNLYADVVFRDD